MNSPLLRVAVISAVCLSLGCNFHSGGSSEKAEPEELEMVVYDAPAGSAQQLRGVLQQAFYQNEGTPPVARATVSPDGKLIVVGPSSVQQGVAGLMKNLGSLKTTQPPTVNFKYWLVLGKKGTGPLPAELAEISEALGAVSTTGGGLEFELLETLSVRSQSEDDGEVEGRLAKVWQTASVSGGALHARMKIDPSGPARLETRVQLDVGQTLVLGESGFDLHPTMLGQKAGDVESRKLFYVVRPSVLEATKTP